MKKVILGLILGLAMDATGRSQVPGDFRSVGSGLWNLPEMWEVYNGTSWDPATIKPDSGNSVYIQSGHFVTLGANEACNDLHIAKGNASNDATQGKLLLGANILKLFGKLRTYYAPVGNVPGTSTTTMTKTLINYSAGGKIKIAGNTRNLTNTGEWSGGGTTNGTDIFPLEMDLNAGQSITMQTSIKASSWLLTSGSLLAGTNRIAVDNGVTGQGNVFIQSGAILSSAATGGGGSAVIGRTSSTRGGILTVNGIFILTGSSPHLAMDSLVLSGSVYYNGTNQSFADSINGGAAVSSYYNVQINGSGIKSICSDLLINGTLEINSGARLTLNPSFTLTLTGNPGMIIKSDATGEGSFVDNGTTSGTIRVEKYLEGNYWHYISSPVSNAGAGVFTGDYLASFNTPDNLWDPNITDPSTPLNIMKGYAVNVPNSSAVINFTGPLNTGSLGIACSEMGEGYNLVGNPYPCAIDLSSSGISWPSDDHTAWFWDPVALNYKVFPTGSTPIHSQYAPAMQGFFIKTTIPGSFQVSNTTKVHNGEPFLKNASIYGNSLFIKIASELNEYNDEAVVCFYPQSTVDYDPSYDAEKIFGGADAPQIFTVIGRNHKVTVNAQPGPDIPVRVPLCVSGGIEGTYTLTMNNMESFDPSIRIYLEDRTEQKIQNVRSMSVYRFNYSKKDEKNRFLLHFCKEELGVADSYSVPAFFIYAQDHIIRILNPELHNGTIVVFDITGRVICRYTAEEAPVTQFTLNTTSGYYLICVISGNGMYTQKIFIQ